MKDSASYTDFAWVYDELMDEVPYEKWTDSVHNILLEHNIKDGLVLDLGCGTGIVTEMLADLGYDMIGIDLSEDMLEIAQEKKYESNNEILYLCQDMRSFELYGTVRGVVSLCDSINYLLSEEDVLKTFKLVNNYLDPKGIFIFDINTPYKYKTIIGNTTIAENREDCSFIWDNIYDEESGINEYQLTLFIKDEDERYTKSLEIHHQKGYSLDTICKLLEKSGMEFLQAFDNDTGFEVNDNTEKYTVIAREKGKKGGM